MLMEQTTARRSHEPWNHSRHPLAQRLLGKHVQKMEKQLNHRAPARLQVAASIGWQWPIGPREGSRSPAHETQGLEK